MLLLTVGCSNEEPTSDSAQEELQTDAAYMPQLLSAFVIIRSDDASEALIKSVKSLNATIKELCGTPLSLYSDFSAKKEAELEIVIGSAKREVSSMLDSLGANEYVIQTVQRSGGASIVVGGNNDASSALAVYEFESYLKALSANGDTKMEIPMISQKGSTLDFAISEEVLGAMVMIQQENVDAKVGTVARYLRFGINNTIGKEMTVHQLTADADISQYSNAIVIGAVGVEAQAIQSQLSANSYTVRVVNENGGTRIYLVGSDDISTMRAVQYYYSKAVVNGKMRLPKYFDMTVTSFVQRDPCIVPFEGKYYMYTSHNKGYGVRVSEDLLNWSSVPMEIYNRVHFHTLLQKQGTYQVVHLLLFYPLRLPWQNE